MGAFLRDTSGHLEATAAAALQDTSRRLDAVLDNTRMAVFLMDHRQHCVYANAAAEQLTGYGFAEMQGRPLHDVIHHKHPDGRHYPLEDCPIDRAFPEDFQVEGEEVFVHKDGSFYPVAFTASPIRDAASQTIGTVIEVRGVAAEKARDAAVRESQERLSAALSAAQLGTFDWNVRTGEVVLDQRSREIFGFSPGEGTRQQDLFGRIDAADVDRVRAEAAESVRTLSRLETEYRIRLPDGSVRTVLSINHMIAGADGSAERAIGVFGDITERSRAEDALRAERDRLYALFEHAPGLVAVAHGPDHVFALANQAYRELVGGRELVGRPVRDALPELIDQGFVELLDRVYRTGEPFIGHAMPTRVGRSDPQERFFDFVYQPIFESDGAVSGIFAQGFDVTERVLFQSQQKLLLDELNHRVKNNLATVQSIAYQTARHAPDLPTFRKTFDQRLVALSRTHDVLTAEAWESADLRAVLEAELGPYGESRVRLQGPPVRLSPQQALALGLVVHELATNAAKYGALNGEDGGCVRITWSDGDGRLVLLWNETDGPAVTPPEHRGFGSRLIQRGVQELGGEVVKDWRPEGLDCRIEIPL